VKVDLDKSHYLYPVEIYSFLKMEPNEFNKRMLSSFDLDKTGRLNFLEYACAMWNFLSMDAGYLGSLAFVIFDADRSNSLDFREVKQLVEMIHHKKYETNEGVRAFVDGLKDISHSINVEQFSKFSKDNPGLCAPLVGLQFILRKRVVGDTFWNTLADRRYHNVEQNNCLYTMELCEFIITRYERTKLNLAIEAKRRERDCSLARIQSAKGDQALAANRSDNMLGFFSLGKGTRREEAEAKAKLQRGKSIKLITDADLENKFISEDDYDRSAFENDKPKKRPRSAKPLRSDESKIQEKMMDSPKLLEKKQSRRAIVPTSDSGNDEGAQKTRPTSAQKQSAKANELGTPQLQKRKSRRTIVPVESPNDPGKMSRPTSAHRQSVKPAGVESDTTDESPSKLRRSGSRRGIEGLAAAAQMRGEHTLGPDGGGGNDKPSSMLMKRGNSRRSLLPIGADGDNADGSKPRQLKLQPLDVMATVHDADLGKDGKKKKKSSSAKKKKKST
jgi:Ca2+-binding EF-hand superfamily protein